MKPQVLMKWLKKVGQAPIITQELSLLELANRVTKVGGPGYLLTK
ncbi:MAG: hypothetical protein NZ702_03175 [Gammaproteobacteria bacterium]|nr:hypothetical protein [Gammaproteobacteria bacterium]